MCRKTLLFIPFIALAAAMFYSCNTGGDAANKKDSVQYRYEQIPKERDTVSKVPVATYFENVPGFSTEEGFAIKVFQTKETFRFLLNIHDKGGEILDTLKIPDFGIWPTVKLQKGDEPYTCIAGFMDKDSAFRVYKQIQVKDQKLTIQVLKHYAVYTYQDTVK